MVGLVILPSPSELMVRASKPQDSRRSTLNHLLICLIPETEFSIEESIQRIHLLGAQSFVLASIFLHTVGTLQVFKPVVVNLEFGGGLRNCQSFALFESLLCLDNSILNLLIKAGHGVEALSRLVSFEVCDFFEVGEDPDRGGF